MSWTIVGFGRHAKKTLPQIVFIDPDWFFWAIEEGVFEKNPKLAQESKDIAYKATRIRVPGKDPSEWKVEYVIHPSVGKFDHIDVVPADMLSRECFIFLSLS